MFKKIFRSSLFKNALTLLSGSLLGQALPVVVSPLLTRYYSPSDFALFAVFMGGVSVLGVVASGRYALALMLPKSEERALDVFFLSLGVAAGFGLVVWLILYGQRAWLAGLIKSPESAEWVGWIVLAAVLTASLQSLNYLFNRNDRYRSISLSKAFQGVGVALGSLCLAILGVEGGLIIGYMVGQVVALVVFGYSLRVFSEKFAAYFAISFAQIKGNLIAAAIRYREYPIFNAPAALCDTLSVHLPIFIFSAAYSTQTVGLFSLTYRVTELPVTLLAFTISQLLFQRFAVEQRQESDIRRTFLKTSLALLLIPIPFVIVLLLFGPSLFAWIFGEEWYDSGRYAQILVLAVWIKFVVSPQSSMFFVQGRVRLASYWQYAYLVTTAGVLGGGVWLAAPFEQVLWAFVLNELLMYLIYFFLIFNILPPKNNVRN
ncbi:MAG: oligosaccharide flippase family protein [Bernardetiaceae bacterium]